MPHCLFAISDIHLSNPENLAYFSALPEHKNDFPPTSGLILAGDVGESILHLRQALEISLKVFKYVWWVPGNHELYTLPKPTQRISVERNEQTQKDAATDTLKGEERYLAFISECHKYPNVFTPEDDYQIWDCSAEDPLNGSGNDVASQTGTSKDGVSRALICPLFTLYDYTYRPSHITSTAAALKWAEEAGIYATDEALLHSDPYPSKEAWCSRLHSSTHAKLTHARQQHPDLPMILVNHWPLSQAVLHIPSIPRFSIWCGSVKTESWTREFEPVAVVVSGHLHVRRTDWIEGTRWEEVSLGYPRQWAQIKEEGLDVWECIREILPGPDAAERARWEGEGTRWRRFGGR